MACPKVSDACYWKQTNKQTRKVLWLVVVVSAVEGRGLDAVVHPPVCLTDKRVRNGTTDDFPVLSSPGTEWNSSTPGTASPSLFQGNHRRTPSEADRWLEEVSKTVRAQQQQQPAPAPQPPLQPPPAASQAAAAAYPVSTFIAPQPVPVGVVPPMQPPFIPAQPYAVANGMTYAAAPSVPVVGITPSQMVANVFGTASHAPAAHPHQSPSLVKQQTFPQYEASSATASPFFNPPAQHNGSAAFNGVDGGKWAAEDKHPQPPAAAPQVDPFEAQWAALESKAKQRTNPSPTNPFSSDLQKTFEIEL